MHLISSMSFRGLMLLLLLSCFSRVRLCAIPQTAVHQAPPVPGILQARILEWVAISFSNAWKWNVKVKSLSCVQLLATPWTAAHQAPPSMGFARQEYWSGLPVPSPFIAWELPFLLNNIPYTSNCYSFQHCSESKFVTSSTVVRENLTS